MASTLNIVAFLVTMVAALSVVGQGNPVGRKSEFTYLGSFTRAKVNVDGSNSVTNSAYYLSHNNAEWETANQDCEDIFDAALVSLETPEEADALQRQLEESGDASTLFWSGGKYNTATKKFVWLSGAELGANAPWEAGQPGLSTRMSRISIRTVEGLKFRSRFNTESARYICEIV